MKPVSELMIKELVTLEPSASVMDAVMLMNDKNIGSVIITEKNHPVGIFTERDLVNKILITTPVEDLKTLRVKDFMSTDLVLARPHQSGADFIDFMREKNIRHLPVVEDGQVVGILSLRDLMWHYSEELTREICERVKALDELEKTHKELQEFQLHLAQSSKMVALGELGAGIAHELNNPLTGVWILIQSYMGEKEPGSEEYIELKEMEEACKHMSKIVRNLNTFIRHTAGEFGAINCNDIIESTLVFSGHLLEKNGMKIEKSYDDTIPLIKGDKGQLQQVILNMITNARDAMSEGGAFRISTRTHSTDKGQFVEMEFSDTGCGISKDDIDKIYDRFFTTKGPGKGVGLGLSIVYTIVKNHNGEIVVESEEDKGTTFKIRLPALKKSS